MSMDEEGNVYFVDRTVDTIKHKGYWVSASEIEAVLQEHPAVVGACVVGVPDEKVGERIKGRKTPAPRNPGRRKTEGGSIINAEY